MSKQTGTDIYMAMITVATLLGAPPGYALLPLAWFATRLTKEFIK